MAVDDQSRHRLHTKLEEVLGNQEAGALMAYLPPSTWTDLATKKDLEQTENRLLATFHSEFTRQTRAMIFSMSALFVSLAALIMGVARLG